MANSSDVIHIQIAYAAPDKEILLALDVVAGTTIQDALLQSQIAQQGVDISRMTVGIYGKKKTLDTVLREHDRIELYRALVADPKESRRRRVNEDKKHKKEE